MSNRNWNSQTANTREKSGGVKSNWSDRGTNSVSEAKAKEKSRSVSLSKGTVSGTVQGMGAATKGGKYHWVGSKDSKW